MAWPLTAVLTTYIANSLPAIKANDLNELQQRVVDIFSGDKTLKRVHVDGTGDAATAASAGEVRASAGFKATGGNLTLDTGDIAVTAGNATLTAGSYTATAGNYTGRHYIGNGSTPGKTAGVGQAAVPVDANITVTGTDAAGTVTVVAGAGVVAGLVCTITFATAYTGKTPRVSLTPADAAAADLATQPYVTATANNFQITTSATALVNGTTYNWQYTIIAS